jgi:K+-transporting ATPase KdpF subunit
MACGRSLTSAAPEVCRSFGCYERPPLRRRRYHLFRGQRAVCALLRKTLGAVMETIIVGILALLLFVYLLVAMLRPEKF